MTIIRVKHDKYNPYMTVKKDILYNNEISAEAKTIYFYAFSRPDDWQFYRDEIGKHMKEGRDQISRALQELQDYGYLKKTPNQDPETGQMQGWSWEFYETPQEGEGIKIFSPKDWNRVSREFRQSENKTLLNKERELNKEKTHKKEAADAACASSSQENDLKAKKDALESTGLLSDSEVIMFMRFELQSILKACELIKQEINVDSPVKWLKACIREKWWENGRIGKSTKIQKLESLKISTATAAKESGIKLNIVEGLNSLHIAGQSGGIEIRRNDLQETKDCIKIARLINKKFNLGNKVIFNELPNKGIFECL